MGKKSILLGIITLFVVVIITSCSSTSGNEPVGTTPILLQLETESSVELAVGEPLVLTLYAHDPMLADVAATAILQNRYDVTQLPATVLVEVPLNAESFILPKLAEGASAAYYVRVQGKTPRGSVMVDFDKGFPNVEITPEVQTIYIKSGR